MICIVLCNIGNMLANIRIHFGHGFDNLSHVLRSNYDSPSPLLPGSASPSLAEVRLRMAESLKQAVGYIEQGQIRLGPEVRSPLGCG